MSRPPLLLPLTFSPLLYFYSFLVTHILYLHHPSTCTLHPPIPYISLRLSASICVHLCFSTSLYSLSLSLFSLHVFSFINRYSRPPTARCGEGRGRPPAKPRSGGHDHWRRPGYRLNHRHTGTKTHTSHILRMYCTCTAHVLHTGETGEKREIDT